MKKEYSFDELVYKAASYCSMSEHCVSEVETKLKAWGASESDSEKVIDRMMQENFIDEKRYCTFFVKDKFRFNSWGKIKIAFQLKSKRLDRTLIAEALELIEENDYQEMLLELLKSKLKGLKYDNNYEKQGKLFRFAQGRGFENNLIAKAIKKIDTTLELEDDF